MKNNSEIYLDSAATASNPKYHVVDDFANPNSTHDAGRRAFSVLESARESIVTQIGAKRPSEIIFTSGATESNNIAIFGLAKAQQKMRNFDGKPKVLISAIEHESVMSPAMHLKELGFDVDILEVDKAGFIDIEKAKTKIDNNAVLVSVQLANTEIGVIQNLKPLVELAHDHSAVFHSDCVGALGRIPIDVAQLNLDSASFAGHKLGTPKGIGALYLKSKTKCEPLIYGSGQEKSMRGGTQNVALAKSFELALKDNIDNMKSNNEHFMNLKKHLYDGLNKFRDVKFSIDNSVDNRYLSNIVHLVFKNKTSESLVLNYGKFGIILSGGPACSSQDNEASHVLKSINVDKNYIDGAVRISFLEDTSIEDIDKFLEATGKICK